MHVKDVAGGLVLGIIAALSLTQFMRSMLFGIDGADGGTFIGVTVLLAIVTASAVFIPAVRATSESDYFFAIRMIRSPHVDCLYAS